VLIEMNFKENRLKNKLTLLIQQVKRKNKSLEATPFHSKQELLAIFGRVRQYLSNN